MKRLQISLILAVIFLFLQAGFAQEAEQAREVEATGLGSIVAGDVAHARDDAVDDALGTGIEQTLGTLVESSTLVENFQLIEDNILSKTRGYVQKWEVVKEGKRDEQLYEVTVKAFIKLDNLKSDLDGIAELIRRKNTPRVMVIIDEKNIGDSPGILTYIEADLNTAETALMEFFMNKGFRFVDRATILRNIESSQAAAILQGDVAQASALGRKVGAEVVLSGKALAKTTMVEAFGARQKSQQATVSVKAIRTDTGDIIATKSADGAFPHIDDIVGGTKAIQRACEKLQDGLLTQILDRWQTDVTTGAAITLNVRGVSDYDQLNKFKGALKYYVRGLSSVIQRDWYEGFATLELMTTANSDDVAQRLSGQNVEGIRVKVVGVSPNSVTVELQQVPQ